MNALKKLAFLLLLLPMAAVAQTNIGYNAITGDWYGNGAPTINPLNCPSITCRYIDQSNSTTPLWIAPIGGTYWIHITGTGVAGVTNVALTAPSWLSVGGSPITSTGTLAISPASAQTSGQVIGTCGASTTFGPCTLTGPDMATATTSVQGAVRPDGSTIGILSGVISVIGGGGGSGLPADPGGTTATVLKDNCAGTCTKSWTNLAYSYFTVTGIGPYNASSTTYVWPNGIANNNSAEYLRLVYVPTAIVVRGLTCASSSAGPAGGTMTFTVRHDTIAPGGSLTAASTPSTVTFAASALAFQTQTYLTDSTAIPAGDYISLQIVNTAAASSATFNSCSIIYTTN